jgi:ribosome-associated protein
MINTADELKDLIVKSLEDKKAENITVLPLSDKIPLAKYMIFASGRSIKNIGAIAEYVALELKHKTNWPAHVEGLGNSDWILLDAGDIIVHIFHPEARERFKLEELWGKRIDNI